MRKISLVMAVVMSGSAALAQGVNGKIQSVRKAQISNQSRTWTVAQNTNQSSGTMGTIRGNTQMEQAILFTRPSEGEAQFDIVANMVNQSRTLKSQSYTVDSNGQSLSQSIQARYGLSDLVSIGLQVTNGSSNANNDFKFQSNSLSTTSKDSSSGIQEPEFSASVRKLTDSGAFFFETGFSPKIGVRETTSSSNNSSTSGNNLVGGNTLGLSLGGYMKSSAIFGSAIFYTIKGDRESQSTTNGSTNTTTTRGGNNQSLILFMESMGRNRIGGAVQVSSTEASTSSTAGSAPITSNSTSMGLLAVYSQHAITESVRISPLFALAKPLSSTDDSTYSKYDVYMGAIKATFTF